METSIAISVWNSKLFELRCEAYEPHGFSEKQLILNLAMASFQCSSPLAANSCSVSILLPILFSAVPFAIRISCRYHQKQTKIVNNFTLFLEIVHIFTLLTYSVIWPLLAGLIFSETRKQILMPNIVFHHLRSKFVNNFCLKNVVILSIANQLISQMTHFDSRFQKEMRK